MNAAGLGEGEPPVPPVPLAQDTPAWVVVRATLDFSDEGALFRRGERLTVDANLEGVKRHLRSGWFEPLPAAAQPPIRHDSEHGPVLDLGGGS